MKARTDAMVNGALICWGLLAVLDNVLFHWIFGLHRLVPRDAALPLEIGLVATGVVLAALGIRREIIARRR